MKFKVGDKFINIRNNCKGHLIRIDEEGYTFQYDILDFFTESYKPVCIKVDTINKSQLIMLIHDGIIEIVNN